MKKLLFLICTLFALSASSQTLDKPAIYGREYRRLVADTLFGCPSDTFAVPTALRNVAMIARKGDSIYLWSRNSYTWILYSSGGGSSLRFGKTGEDNSGGEDRIFDLNYFRFKLRQFNNNDVLTNYFDYDGQGKLDVYFDNGFAKVSRLQLNQTGLYAIHQSNSADLHYSSIAINEDYQDYLIFVPGSGLDKGGATFENVIDVDRVRSTMFIDGGAFHDGVGVDRIWGTKIGRSAGVTPFDYRGIQVDTLSHVFLDSTVTRLDVTGMKVLLEDTATGRVWRIDPDSLGGGGTAYTFTNGLTESPAGTVKLGGALTQNTTISGASGVYDFTVSQMDDIGIYGGSDVTIDAFDVTGESYVYLFPTSIELRSSNTGVTKISQVNIDDDSILINPYNGVANVALLRQATDTTLSKPMTWDPATGRWQYLPYWPTGGGAAATVQPSINNFRITTETAVPVSTSDRTSQGTIYLTPYNGNHISLYNGSSWDDISSAEVSLALSSLTSGKNYDVFAYNNSGTVTLEFLVWTNDNTRATALVRQDGVLVKSGATTRRYVGTFRTTSTTTTEDSKLKRFVWNQDNRVPRFMEVTDGTDSWSYTSSTIRQANNSAANQVEYVTGDASVLVQAEVLAQIYLAANSAQWAAVGVGVSSTTAISGRYNNAYNAGPSGMYQQPTASYKGQPGLGYFYLAWLERGADGTSSIFIGDNGGGAGAALTGLTATIEN